MGEVTGPISTLPGTSHSLPEGSVCDYHPDRTAVARIQGETDSMGCEMDDLCQECVDARREEARNADTSGNCDWCKNFAQRLRHRRDYEEGMSGPVYRVCDPCIEHREAEALAYLKSTDAEFDFGDFEGDR